MNVTTHIWSSDAVGRRLCMRCLADEREQAVPDCPGHRTQEEADVARATKSGNEDERKLLKSVLSAASANVAAKRIAPIREWRERAEKAEARVRELEDCIRDMHSRLEATIDTLGAVGVRFESCTEQPCDTHTEAWVAPDGRRFPVRMITEEQR